MLEKPQFITKRKIVRGVAVALVATGAYFGARMTDKGNSTTDSSTKSEILLSSSNSIQIEGVTIYQDKNDIPIGYELYDKTYQIPNDKVEEMKRTMQSAKDSQEPKLLLNIPGEYLGIDKSYQFTPDRPGVFELPPDVLSESELKKYGVVEIIQGKQTKLHIRKEAFNKEGILYNLLRAQSLNNPVKLRIVLVDGPAVAEDYMVDPKYNKVQGIAPFRTKGPEEFREEEINKLKTQLMVRLNLLHTARSKLEKDNARYGVYSLLADINDYENASIDQLIEKINLDINEAAGVYKQPDENSKVKVATVFVAVGATLPVQEQIKFFANPDGTIGTSLSLGIEHRYIDYGPDESKGFPRKKDFAFNPGANRRDNDYPYGAQNNEAGFVLTHELTHFNKITLIPLLTSIKPDFSEFNTDTEAMQQIDKEYRMWLAQGTNKLKNPYPFVFQQGGMYQVTKSELANQGIVTET